ncbi:MAG TPA: type IV pilin protein [Rhizobacter sp.]|nr:type IV pilin protein [Rhizobacter sp.]
MTFIRRSAPHRSVAGFTLIEVTVVTAIVGILASLAYPSLQGPVFKARRTDGLVALMDLQMAQERWRSNNMQYATLAQLNAPTVSPMRYYQLSVSPASAQGFEATATATGLQTGDSACKVMRIKVTHGNTVHASGPNGSADNNPAANQRCWNQ